MWCGVVWCGVVWGDKGGQRGANHGEEEEGRRNHKHTIHTLFFILFFWVVACTTPGASLRGMAHKANRHSSLRNLWWGLCQHPTEPLIGRVGHVWGAFLVV